MAQQIVNSYTAGDPLEVVVVGRLAGGVFPSWQPSMSAVLPEDSVRLFQEREESPYVANDLFRGGDILEAPKPTLPSDWSMYFCDPWVSMNILSLDERTVVVEGQEEPLIEALQDWSSRCIPVDFRHVYTFGGSFHCVTLDVRRRGELGQFLN